MIDSPEDIIVSAEAYYQIIGHRYGAEFTHGGKRYEACGSDGTGLLAFKLKSNGGHVRHHKQARFKLEE